MQSIKNLFEMSPAEIEYRISCLTESQREILLHLARGRSDTEIAEMSNISTSAIRVRLASACDRVGVDRRAQLICLFSIWKYGKTHAQYGYAVQEMPGE